VKKILAIVILLSYSVASLGISLNYFYCCGKLKTVSFYVKPEVKDCKSKSKKGCCDNKTVTIKLKIDQKENSQPACHLSALLAPVIHYTDDFSPLSLATNCRINPLYKRPPPGNLPSIQVLYSIFRI
jgi:hypothetical protein